MNVEIYAHIGQDMNMRTYHPFGIDFLGVVSDGGEDALGWIRIFGELLDHQLAVLRSALPRVLFDAHSILPSEGARYGADAMCLTCRGRVAVVAVGSSFYALSGRSVSDGYFLGQNLADQHGRGEQPTSLHNSDEGAGGWSDHGDATAGRRQRPTEVYAFPHLDECTLQS